MLARNEWIFERYGALGATPDQRDPAGQVEFLELKTKSVSWLQASPTHDFTLAFSPACRYELVWMGDESKSSGESPQTPLRTTIERLCREVLAPLVAADGGVLYLVEVTAQEIHLHLAGTCAGCPGSEFTRQTMIEPVLKGALPHAELRLTTGWIAPPGSEKIG